MKMTMYEFLIKHVFTPALDFHRGGKTMKGQPPVWEASQPQLVERAGVR